MSKSVDERIVEMRINNQQFEKGAKESISTLERLKKSLNLEGADKNLKKLEQAGKEFSLEVWPRTLTSYLRDLLRWVSSELGYLPILPILQSELANK